jgi:cytochrome c556
MLRTVALAAALAVGATAVYAQNLPVIKERRETMRAIAGQSTPVFKMSKGEEQFDLAKVQTGIKIMSDGFTKFKGLFPADAKTGGETDADPTIWTKRDEFEGVIQKVQADLAAAASAIKDEATFKEHFAKITGGCGGCHKASDGFTVRLGDSFKKPRP